MTEPKSKDPLHGITLERLLTELVAHYGWREMGRRVAIRCFLFDPSIKSSLAFLRKNPWARSRVEVLYVGLVALRGEIPRAGPITQASTRIGRTTKGMLDRKNRR